MERRLNAYLSRAGIASRRGAVPLVKQGRVKVNGTTTRDPSYLVGAEDLVECNGRAVSLPTSVVFLLNKPPGHICSTKRQDERPVVTELIDFEQKLFPVGRLDYMTGGLLLLSNDGDIAQRIAHPSKQVEKEYLLESGARIPKEMLQAYLRGLRVGGVRYTLTRYTERSPRSVHLVLVEGKNREIRRVCEHFSVHIRSITRLRVGGLQLGHIRPGHYRKLSPKEIAACTRS